MNETILKEIIRKTISDTMENSTFSQDEEPFLIVAGWDEINYFERGIFNALDEYTNTDADQEKIEDLGLNMTWYGITNENNYGKFFEDCMTYINTEWGFGDEYTLCSDCYKVIRTSPTSYDWTPDYTLGDGYIICNECAKENKEEYIQEYINNQQKAITWLNEDEIIDMGFVQLNKEHYETGFHSHMDDSPAMEFQKFQDQYEEIVFTIYANSQFYTTWDIWGRNI